MTLPTALQKPYPMYDGFTKGKKKKRKKEIDEVGKKTSEGNKEKE